MIKGLADRIVSRITSSDKPVIPAASPPVPTMELGVAGAKISGGFVYDEFLPQLVGERGRRVFREMRDNDATVGAVLFAIEMVLRKVDWRIQENSETKGTPESEDAAKFVDGVLFKDMENTWDEFLSDVLTMLVYGWEFTEVVYKRRIGPNEVDPKKRSRYNDGAIGIRKLGARPQETLDKWLIDEYGTVHGMYQQPPEGGPLRFIPMSKALLFLQTTYKSSPEGRSVLRGAYRSWYFLKNIQEIEAIAIERELNGLPVVKIPNAILNGTSAEAVAAKNAYIKLVRDIKFNEQGGVVIPSDPYYDADGKPTGVQQVSLELLASKGTRAIQTGETVLRYQREIARTVMADFIMLGSNDRGSFAMSKDKSSLFIKGTEGWLTSIAENINRNLITKLWKFNNFPQNTMPSLLPGSVAPIDLDELGKYISDLARAGAPLFPDKELEDKLREVADLPYSTGENEDIPIEDDMDV
jgi:hypothetical protein